MCRARDTGDWKSETITPAQISDLVRAKIATVSFAHIKEDVRRFVKEDAALQIWSPGYFNDLLEKLKFENVPQ
jgi:hypothetical protein